MTGTLRDLLRQDADDVAIPTLDPDDVVARGEQRLHRRRRTAGLAAVAAVAVVAVGSVLVTRADPDTQGPLPGAPPSSSTSGDGAVDPRGARPLVYAEGSTVHVGDRTVQAPAPVAFIDATDDGAVYEAALDGTLWFTDGTSASVIGASPFTAAPTAHGGVVTTGDSGSLVVWADATGREDTSPELVVYDTARREEVARIPSSHPGRAEEVVHVGEDQVWFTPSSGPGCWVGGPHPCSDPHLFRFDVPTGETTKVTLADLDAELGTQPRTFVAEDDLAVDAPGFSQGASFRQVGGRLVPVTSGGDPVRLTRANGDQVRLGLPDGYVAPGPEGSGGIAVSQWLDDDHVVLWADDGGGDLPAKEGDLLVCRLPDGTCRVAVPRSPGPYVAP